MTFGGDAAYKCAGPDDDRAPAKTCAPITRSSTGSYQYTFIQSVRDRARERRRAGTAQAATAATTAAHRGFLVNRGSMRASFPAGAP